MGTLEAAHPAYHSCHRPVIICLLHCTRLDAVKGNEA
jgi:hypothetical protein